MPDYSVTQTARHWLGEFSAMASPCQLLLEGGDRITAQRLTEMIQFEAKRIERKFSRYRDDNIVYAINHANGEPVSVDEETTLLLDFADQCYALSDGMFDVTSGILRQVWRFDGGEQLPSHAEVQALISKIGWQRVSWASPQIQLAPGMEIDLGGIGKEYAVDQCFGILKQQTELPFLLNFGGDLRASGTQISGRPWQVGIENPNLQDIASGKIEIQQGALATSGDSRRYLLRDGKRYSHILNPKTGWPVENAPRSITVAAATTIEAGMLATFASLQGDQAAQFLKHQDVQFWLLQ
jgi:thiamine biosynthesis lipoprotein